MKPLLHPSFVNGRFGDPAVYVEHLFERHALMLDLGDITTLPPRKINRIDKVFISHTHIDHFIGFDHLLRVLVGRDETVSLWGPSGLIDSVDRKLHAYAWNLAQRYDNDLTFVVADVAPSGEAFTARFRLHTAFAREMTGGSDLPRGVLCDHPALRVTAVTLDHRTPSLGFALTEPIHLNVWNTRLAARGLPVGPWLAELKRAILAGQPDDTLIAVREQPSAPVLRVVPLGELRDLLTVTPGQKIGYITDVADTPTNRAAIIELVTGADILFIESAFAAADAALAADRAHLTTRAAGEIARAAGVARVEPFHFSARYEGEEARMLAEVETAFRAASL
jgi:ribonuclease Z